MDSITNVGFHKLVGIGPGMFRCHTSELQPNEIAANFLAFTTKILNLPSSVLLQYTVHVLQPLLPEHFAKRMVASMLYRGLSLHMYMYIPIFFL